MWLLNSGEKCFITRTYSFVSPISLARSGTFVLFLCLRRASGNFKITTSGIHSPFSLRDRCVQADAANL
jgi:hypothetical protein